MSSTEALCGSWRQLLGRSHAQPLALICFAVWFSASDSLLVATMIPAIAADIGGFKLLPWMISLYEIGSIVAGASSSLLAVRYGFRNPMAIASAIFCGGCIASALAASMNIMLLGRLVQGLGAGALMTLAFVGTGSLFPSQLAPLALTTLSTIWGAAAFVAPLLGALFTQFASWRIGFWVFAGQSLILTLCLIIFRPAAEVQLGGKLLQLQRFGVPKLGALFLSILLISVASSQLAGLWIVSAATLGIALLVLFFWLDGRHGPDRLLPHRPIGLLRGVSAALTMELFLSIATIAFATYGPFFMTMIHHATPITAGYVIAASSITWTCSAVIISPLSARFDRILIACGVFCISISIVGLSYAVAAGPISLICGFSVLRGLGYGMAWTPIFRLATSMVGEDREENDRVLAALPTIQRLGYAIGAGYAGMVANVSGIGSIDVVRLGDVAISIFVAALAPALIANIAAVRFLTSKDIRRGP